MTITKLSASASFMVTHRPKAPTAWHVDPTVGIDSTINEALALVVTGCPALLDNPIHFTCLSMNVYIHQYNIHVPNVQIFDFIVGVLALY
jgi:hypothetical protein